MNTRSKILIFTLACISGTIFLLASAEALFLVVGDVFTGALSGRAESGWGILIALYLFLPVAIVTFLVFRISSKKYKVSTNQPSWYLWVVTLFLVAGIVSAWTFLDHSGPVQLPPESAQDMATTQQLEKAKSQISTYYYNHGDVLAQESALSPLLATGVTYRIINQNTYELCGNFTSDSISPLYKKGSANLGGAYQKVVDGKTLEGTDTVGIFRIHSANQQCYKLGLNPTVN